MRNSSVSPVQVDVIVQDYFFEPPLEGHLEEHEEFKESKADRPASPISQEMWESWFPQWLEQLQAELPQHSGYELSLRLTDDDEIRSLNAQYRHTNQPTDVLAFAALEMNYPSLEDDDSPLYLGDIVISVETAQQQASRLGHTLQQELAWLAAHAFLHLLGWDHPDENSLSRMLKQQESLLKTVGLTLNAHQIGQLLQLEYRNDPSEEV